MNKVFATTSYLLSAAIVLLLIGCGTPPEKPTGDVPPNSYFVTGWAVGHWVRYDYTTSGVGSSVYLAITDSESIGGETYFWLETVRKTGTAITATRQLIGYYDSNSFLEASGGLLPGATRYVVKPAFSSPAEELLTEGRSNPIIDYQRVFGGGSDVEIISVDENVEYKAPSGKELICVRKILMLDEKNVGSVLTTKDVPITEIAFAEGTNRKLELVDFGFSGAGSVF